MQASYCFLQSCFNLLQYALCVVHHLVVPEPQHSIALHLEIGRALIVPLLLLDVLAAIQLDDQPLTWGAEISYIGADGMLAPEVDALLPERTQVRPKAALGRCHHLAQLPSAV